MLELPPITFDHAVVPASPVDVDILSTFVKWVFPFDRKDELQEQLARERHLVHELIHNNGYKLTTMNALQAINSSVATLRRYMGMQKVPAIAEIIKEELRTKAYEKIVIFAIHRDVIEHLRIALCKFGAVTLYGGTPPEKRQIKIDKFMNTKKCRVFIGNIQCCGTAITLTAAHHVVFAEQSWVPSENAQAMMRCHRIGQRKPVSVRFFALADSFDERLMFVLKKKTKDLTQVFDGQWREMYAEDEESDELIVPQPPQG